MANFIDETGNKYGRLTVLKCNGKDKYNTYRWLCKCECGNETVALGASLRAHKITTCGCLKTTHDMSKDRIYNIWKNMKQRCLNANSPYYYNYGGRGIAICEEWKVFENFRDDMYNSYLEHCEEFSEKQTTIDRINNNSNYELLNCRWATIEEQQSNTRRSFYFKATDCFGNEHISNHQCCFSKKNNLHKSNISRCLSGKQSTHKGWTFRYLTATEIETLENNND